MENRVYQIVLYMTTLILASSTFLLTPLLAKNISLIRDAEIENTIRSYSKPLLIAASLEPSSIRIHIVKDNTLNAFVAGGQQIFVNSGLILQSNNAGQIIGVLAHEIGHISGGHLIKGTKARKDISATSILGVLLGGAAIIAGHPDAGKAAIQLGSNIGAKNYLSFSRTQESAADQTALRLLEQTKQSSVGLLEFMEKLEDQELLSTRNQDPYIRTHPLSRNRLSTIRRHLEKSSFTNKPITLKYMKSHKRIKAKLVGFTQTFSRTLRQFPEKDKSLVGIYARSIAYFRKPNMQKAIELINKLIAKMPNDPYFHELKGQFYFENGKINPALESYQTAANLMPESPLLRFQLARAQIEKNEPNLLKLAVKNLSYAINKDATRPNIWRQLSIAYGRLGKKGDSLRALAEEAVLLGRNTEAIKIAERAKKHSKIGTQSWLQAEDIIAVARENPK